MKHLYLIRHAKSDWSDERKNDFERGLNKRGKKAIPTMGKALIEKDVMPDLILSSSATRAKLTAKGLAKEIGYKGEIKCIDALYMADPLDVISIIKKIKDKYHTVFVVGHNPETTELTDILQDDYIENVPTLGIVAFEVPVQKWSKFKPEKARMDFFIYPKMYT